MLRTVIGACALVLISSTVFAQVRANYLYTLSDFSGRLRHDWGRIYVDQERDETYVIYGNLVRIFNSSGMEVFRFGDDLDLGQILDVAVDRKGDIILLSYKDSRTLVTRCDFRGVPIGGIEITKLPDGLAFGANRMVYRNDRFYFVSQGGARVIVTGADGKFLDSIDLFRDLEAEDRQKSGAEIIGFAVDTEGSIIFTVPVVFKVYKLLPDGKLLSFGRPGSAPGRFGVVAGVAADDSGRILVADKLKCVVMVFDKDFSFLNEFGYRGARPENLIVPDDIAVDRRGRVFVTQGRNRGVSVFALSGR